MEYTHYIKLDEPLTEAQASTFRDACMDFVSLVPDAFLGEALERSDRFSKMDAPAAMTKTEADIYRLLESDCGRFFSYREIFSAVCGEGYFAENPMRRRGCSGFAESCWTR